MVLGNKFLKVVLGATIEENRVLELIFKFVLISNITELCYQVKDNRLKSLARRVPDLLAYARSRNMNKKYACYFQKFETWCNRFPEAKSYPTEDNFVALYLVNLIQSGESFSAIESSFYAIKHKHKFCNINPCNSNICKMLLDAAKRICRKDLKKKLPITVAILNKIYDSLNGDKCSLLQLRTISMLILGFAGFMRYSEISDLKRCDFVFRATHLEIFL